MQVQFTWRVILLRTNGNYGISILRLFMIFWIFWMFFLSQGKTWNITFHEDFFSFLVPISLFGHFNKMWLVGSFLWQILEGDYWKVLVLLHGLHCLRVSYVSIPIKSTFWSAAHSSNKRRSGGYNVDDSTWYLSRTLSEDKFMFF